MNINYPKIIFLNLVAAYLMLQILISKISIIPGFENILFLTALTGFILSFSIKENLFIRYLKIISLNSLFFGFIFALFFMSDIFISDSQAEFTLNGLILSLLFFGVVYFFGALAGAIPQGIREKLQKQQAL